MARSQVQYGSQGNDVRELQKLLNQSGYKLTEDGIFGTNTKNAVLDYQKKNGLAVDGIVGVNTWGALDKNAVATSSTLSTGSTNSSTNTSTTNNKPNLTPYETGSYIDSTDGAGKGAWDAYQDAWGKVNEHGENFTYGNQQQLTDLITKILGRDKFTYDLNGDALYQQYKDKYIQQGKMAMGDAIGQASAMTGGYGNSYAQSVGQQAYQSSLDNLNDIVPELYQMALDKHNMEGQELLNQYGVLADDYTRQYGAWNDKYGRLMDAVEIARGDYYDGANLFYTEQNNKNNVIGMQNEDAWRGAEWDRDQTWRDEDIAYRDARDLVEDNRWEKEFGLAEKETNSKVSSTTGNGGSSSSGYVSGDKGAEAPNYTDLYGDPIPTSTVKALQDYLGVTADGIWGEESAAAAGGRNVAEALKAWENGNLFPTSAPKQQTYTYEETPAVTSFVAKIRTRSEFARATADKEKYKTYNDYVRAMLEKYEGDLTDNDIATISQKFGL